VAGFTRTARQHCPARLKTTGPEINDDLAVLRKFRLFTVYVRGDVNHIALGSASFHIPGASVKHSQLYFCHHR